MFPSIKMDHWLSQLPTVIRCLCNAGLKPDMVLGHCRETRPDHKFFLKSRNGELSLTPPCANIPIQRPRTIESDPVFTVLCSRFGACGGRMCPTITRNRRMRWFSRIAVRRPALLAGRVGKDDAMPGDVPLTFRDLTGWATDFAGTLDGVRGRVRFGRELSHGPTD
jgi:hypothetical protein